MKDPGKGVLVQSFFLRSSAEIIRFCGYPRSIVYDVMAKYGKTYSREAYQKRRKSWKWLGARSGERFFEKG